MDNFLTLGQASCLVLGLEPTPENREKAKKVMEDTPFAVTYRHGQNPKEPMAIAKSLVKLDPFKYREYPPQLQQALPMSRLLWRLSLRKRKSGTSVKVTTRMREVSLFEVCLSFCMVSDIYYHIQFSASWKKARPRFFKEVLFVLPTSNEEAYEHTFSLRTTYTRSSKIISVTCLTCAQHGSSIIG